MDDDLVQSIAEPRGPFRTDDAPEDAQAEQCAFAASYAMTTAARHFPGNLDWRFPKRILRARTS